MKQLAKYFLNGLLFLIPVALTIYVFFSVFTFADGLLRWLLPAKFNFPGIGLLLTLVLVTLFGFLTTNLITKRFFHYIDGLFNRLPLIKLVYSTVKDVIAAFVGDKKSFDKPVLVTVVPGSEIKAAGFITRETLDKFNLTDHVAVYFPQSYNFAGSVLLVPTTQVTVLETDSAELMTFIVSAGITGK